MTKIPVDLEWADDLADMVAQRDEWRTRAEAAEMELESALAIVDLYQEYMFTAEKRVAELEAAQAAHGWRPVTEPPTDEGEYWGYDEHDRHNSVFITHYTPEHDYEDGWAWSDWEGELIPVSKWLPLTYPPPPTRDESR